MLVSPDHRTIISNLGWVDKGSLWTYDTVQDEVALISLGDAKYLSLFACQDLSHFAVLHHYDGASIRVSIHAFENAATPLCTVERSGNTSSASGDLAVLEGAPRYYVAYFDSGQDRDYQLLHLDNARGKIRAEPLPWYDSSYDKGYQGLVGVLELPSGNLIISVQRDSHPVVYDPVNRRVLRKLDLADRLGNPTFRLAAHRREIWTDDYDTILRLDLGSLRVKQSRRLQNATGTIAQFIGRWSLNEDESLCFVPRPYSGDMVAISTENLKTEYTAKLGTQPLDAIALEDGRVLARDWQAGQLLRGVLRKA